MSIGLSLQATQAFQLITSTYLLDSRKFLYIQSNSVQPLAYIVKVQQLFSLHTRYHCKYVNTSQDHICRSNGN